MAQIVGWQVLLGDEWAKRPGPERGERRRVGDAEVVVYAGSVLEVETDDPRWPRVRVTAHVEEGERLRCANRHAIRVPSGERVCMPFLEVLRTDGSFARLYLHAEHGPVLSTRDLYL